VAKLYELDRDGDFDLLVLDTPPSRNALDFLDAPTRLTSFLEGRALKVFIRPTGLGMRVLGRGAAPLLSALRRVTGVDLISDLTTFFGLLGDMTDDFSERARGVERMLKASTTAFVLVTSAQQAAIDEAIWFRRTLIEGGLPFAGVIVNRVHHDILGEAEPEDLVSALDTELAGELASRVAENFFDYHRLARRDAHNMARLRGELGTEPILLVPHLDDDVHDVEGLLRVHRYLFASDEERERLIADVIA
jgi:anion-transporting  ArsA/GET3 family ATPase